MRNCNFLYWILAAMLFVTSCQDDDQQLGSMLDKSKIDFEVVQDFNADRGGNTVILKNNTPGTVSMWDYGIGRSNRAQDTVRFAFKGDYLVKFSVMTAGGIVEMDPVSIKVAEDNLDYVSGELWTLLTGGVGSAKTWILDNGKYGLAPGPVSYADPAEDQVWGDYTPNWEPGPSTDYGNYDAAEMTFNLIGGPFMTTVKPNEETGDESGTFFLNVNTHTLSTTDATIIRPANFIPTASNWNSNLNILELTENQLRVAVFRTNSQGPWWYILNYVSKEYAENYDPGPDPNFDHGNQSELISVSLTTVPKKTWKLDVEVPYNWASLTGELLNDWNSRADIIATGWAPYGDDDVTNIDGVSITFFQEGDVVELKQDDGTVETGTYTIDEATNMITFSGIKPSIPIAGWVTAATTEENQWKIVRIERSDINNAATGLWLGARSPEKEEYMVFHFVAE